MMKGHEPTVLGLYIVILALRFVGSGRINATWQELFGAGAPTATAPSTPPASTGPIVPTTPTNPGR